MRLRAIRRHDRGHRKRSSYNSSRLNFQPFEFPNPDSRSNISRSRSSSKSSSRHVLEMLANLLVDGLAGGAQLLPRPRDNLLVDREVMFMNTVYVRT